MDEEASERVSVDWEGGNGYLDALVRSTKRDVLAACKLAKR